MSKRPGPTIYNVAEHLAGCRLTIDHGALVENWKLLNDASPKARTGAVVKANGYGLGLGEVGLSLAAAGCDAFFVATPDEGVRLRSSLRTREIFVFGGLTARNAATYAENNLVPVLNSLEDIRVWADFWALRGSRRPCALQLDTGMNRFGLSADDILSFAQDKAFRYSVNVITVMSHLACGDDAGSAMNAAQLARFNEYSKTFEGCELSLANSAGIFLGSDYHFDLVRPGIALYGGECGEAGKPATKSVVLAEARIAQIRTAKKGEVIGYGGAYTFTRDSKIALVSVGYGDGYHRAASGQGVALRDNGSIGAFGAIGGKSVPVIGRVSMDCTAFDVTDISDQELSGSTMIELFGNHISLDDAARAAGTIGYELLTSLGQRYFRNHINQPEHSSNG